MMVLCAESSLKQKNRKKDFPCKDICLVRVSLHIERHEHILKTHQKLQRLKTLIMHYSVVTSPTKPAGDS